MGETTDPVLIDGWTLRYEEYGTLDNGSIAVPFLYRDDKVWTRIDTSEAAMLRAMAAALDAAKEEAAHWQLGYQQMSDAASSFAREAEAERQRVQLLEAALRQLEWGTECPKFCLVNIYLQPHWHCPLCEVRWMNGEPQPAHEPTCDLGIALAAAAPAAGGAG